MNEHVLPPKTHIHKAKARIEHLESLAQELHPAIEPIDSKRMPGKLVRRHYLQAYEIVIRDYKRILNQLEQRQHQ